MEDSTTKEKILKEVRNALISKLENPFKDVDFSKSILQEMKELPEVEFALNLNNVGGIFVYCENEKMFTEHLQTLIKHKKWKSVYTQDDKLFNLLTQTNISVDTDPANFNNQVAGVTRCEFLVARFGSVVVSSALSSGRRMFVYPEVHIVYSTSSQVVKELKDALTGLKNKYSDGFPSQITMITGPSRTADIEKTLVMGAHGPKELYVFMVDDL
ncbi:MAG TPA: LUD domain-containing protein [Bacteroidales bacterium]